MPESRAQPEASAFSDLLRACLATPTYTLTAAWAGRPRWSVHHMALGESIGFSTRLTQNNQGLYETNFCTRWVHIALMGDPTLRMFPVAPPTSLSLNQTTPAKQRLSWQPSRDPVLGYHVYRATSSAGPFTRLTSNLIHDTAYEVGSGGNADCYMVRAVALQSSGSGSYLNASQGVFEDRAGSFAPPALSYRWSDGILRLTWPLSSPTLDFRLEGRTLGPDGEWLPAPEAVEMQDGRRQASILPTGSGRMLRLARPLAR